MAKGFHMPVGSSTREAFRVMASRPLTSLQEWGMGDRYYYGAPEWDNFKPTGTVRARCEAKAASKPKVRAGWADNDPRWER